MPSPPLLQDRQYALSKDFCILELILAPLPSSQSCLPGALLAVYDQGILQLKLGLLKDR